MNDQADMLRQRINKLKNESTKKITKPSARVITITSGKGGVGKTNITVNLALALSEMGLRVVVIDADLGLANVELILGRIPKFNLLDLIDKNKNIIEVLTAGPNNIKFISGGSGVEQLTKLTNEQVNKFISNIALLDKIADVILIDTGAGISENIISFIMAAEDILLVTTPEPTAITDAYAVIKTINSKQHDKKINLIINRAESASEAQSVMQKINMVSQRYLKRKNEYLGFVLNDPMVAKAVRQQQPLLLSYPKTIATDNIKDIAKKIVGDVNNNVENTNLGVKNFFNKFLKFSKN